MWEKENAVYRYFLLFLQCLQELFINLFWKKNSKTYARRIYTKLVFLTILLGQGPSEQSFNSSLFPEQLFPPEEGAGLSHDRVRDICPRSHDFEHDVHVVHADQ